MNSPDSMTAGWVDGVRRTPSPNQDDRPEGESVSLIVIHAISLPPSQFGSADVEHLFTNTLDPDAHPYFSGISALRVSAHFLIRRNGELIQFVSCNQRAWHAGISNWQGREHCNDFSIGIELEGCDDIPFDDAQYEQLIKLVRLLNAHYPIVALTGHADIAPDRKTDPGPCFTWQRLAMQGIPPHTAG